MGLESATYVNDLVSTNPITADNVSQGDDHLRLIKEVLKTTFPNATKTFYFPTTAVKSADYSVLSTDAEKTFLVDTTAAVTLTLPSLAAGDAGWRCYVIKTTTDANPVYIVPPSGTINGYTKVRRSVPHLKVEITWSGTLFTATRQFGVPIGASIPFHGSALPAGMLWPDGSTFTAADYVELNSVLGGNTKADMRGRVPACKDDVGGTSANRLTNQSGGLNGDTLGAAGGSETHTLTEAQLAAHTHTQTAQQPTFTYTLTELTGGGGGQNIVSAIAAVGLASTITTTADATPGSTASTGSGTAHNNVQPTIITNYGIVAE